jgi:Na+/proline symporter
MHPQTERAGRPVTGDIVADLLSRWLAIAALGVIALVHALQLPDAFDETLYLGLLFVLAAAGALLLAIALSRTDDRRAWLAATVLPALILLGFVLSRTSGLPAATDDVGNWREPLGLVSLVAESLLVGLGAGVLVGAGAPARTRPRSAPLRSTDVQLLP